MLYVVTTAPKFLKSSAVIFSEKIFGKQLYQNSCT